MNDQSLPIEKEALKDPRLKRAHVKQFEESGLTLTAYCKLTGINTSTLSGWRKRYGESEFSSEQDRFVEVVSQQVASLPNKMVEELIVKLYLTDGRAVEISGHLGLQEIVTLIKELS